MRQFILSIFCLLIIASSHARDSSQVREFRKTHPCPATGQTSGACPGWVVDHVYPLCAGGADAPDNMMWQAKDQSFAKDRIERELCRLKTAPKCPV